MIEGTLDVERSGNSYRWTFISTGGAMFLGGIWHKTHKAALAEGKIWQQSVRTS